MMDLETGARAITLTTNAEGAAKWIHAPNVVTFRFALQQTVRIKALGKLDATIIARGERIGAHIYSVVWWADNKRNEAWLYEHELEG